MHFPMSDAVARAFGLSTLGFVLCPQHASQCQALREPCELYSAKQAIEHGRATFETVNVRSCIYRGCRCAPSLSILTQTRPILPGSSHGAYLAASCCMPLAW